jgi:hypothetical protein
VGISATTFQSCCGSTTDTFSDVRFWRKADIPFLPITLSEDMFFGSGEAFQFGVSQKPIQGLEMPG